MDVTSWNQQLLIAGVRFRRYQPRNPDWLNQVLALIRLMVSQGEALPWLGFLVDLEAWVEHGGEDLASGLRQDLASHPVFLKYQDVVLERWRRDPEMMRVRRALLGRSTQERREGLLFLLESWVNSGVLPGLRANAGLLAAGLPSSENSPEFTRHAAEMETWPESVLALARETIQFFGSMRQLVGPEVVDLIERGLATMDRAPRVQMAQLIKARLQLTHLLGPIIPHSVETLKEIPSRERAAGDVPLGGYNAISTRGRLESLVPSQLVWLDIPIGEATLFAVKYERQELLYYSRQDNRLHQRLRHVAFIIDDSLGASRNKPKTLPFQRMTLVMACLLTLWSRIEGILAREALRLSWIFVGNRNKLKDEFQLLSRLLAPEVAEGRMAFEYVSEKNRDAWIEQQYRERGLFQPIDITVDGVHGFPERVPNEQHRMGIMLQGDRLLLRDVKNQPLGDSVWPDDWARTMGMLEELLTAT
jgi:vWA domain found in the FtsH ternary systems